MGWVKRRESDSLADLVLSRTREHDCFLSVSFSLIGVVVQCSSGDEEQRIVIAEDMDDHRTPRAKGSDFLDQSGKETHHLVALEIPYLIIRA
jgi:hypothetical protein